MAPSHFDQRVRDWSARKHAILKAYLPTFCTALSRQGTIWYVDGYAGAGVYKNPSDPNDPGESGSPVLAAQVTQQLPYDIRCLNVEEDKDNAEAQYRIDQEAYQQQATSPYSQLSMFDEPIPDSATQQAQHIENIQAAMKFFEAWHYL